MKPGEQHIELREGKVVIWRVIEAPIERAWELLISLEQWPKWGPSVTGVRVEDQDARGARWLSRGLAGQVQIAGLVWAPFVVTDFEPLRRWRWAVFGVEATGHEVISLGPTRCVVSMDMPLWAAPYVWVCAVALRRIEALASR